MKMRYSVQLHNKFLNFPVCSPSSTEPSPRGQRLSRRQARSRQARTFPPLRFHPPLGLKGKLIWGTMFVGVLDTSLVWYLLVLPSETHAVANMTSLRAIDGNTSYHSHESFSLFLSTEISNNTCPLLPQTPTDWVELIYPLIHI